MMESEKRRERRAVYTHQPKGKLQVLIGAQSLEVFTVKDASQSGLQLEVRRKVIAGENIMVRYHSTDVDLKLNGTVMWSRNTARETIDATVPDNFLLGIRLASPSLLQTFW
jgi:hypothetical protein